MRYNKRLYLQQLQIIAIIYLIYLFLFYNQSEKYFICYHLDTTKDEMNWLNYNIT